MKVFQARFVLYGRGVDADGFLFWRDVTTVAPGELVQLLPANFADVSGGYVFFIRSQGLEFDGSGGVRSLSRTV
jgi:hypothetical protein